MTTATKYKAKQYFENLNKSAQQLVRNLISETFESEAWDVYAREIEDLECHSRDGFTPFDHNRGGVQIVGFTSVSAIVGSGMHPAHEGAAAEIDRQYEYHLECVAESTFEKFEALLTSLKLTKEDCRYHRMDELSEKHPELKEVRRYIENSECDSDGQDSIMYSLRFMYHGSNSRGYNRASVSAAVNTEGPYHRSHISWAPHVFCEGAKEIEISWKTQAELKRKLKIALSKVVKATF